MTASAGRQQRRCRHIPPRKPPRRRPTAKKIDGRQARPSPRRRPDRRSACVPRRRLDAELVRRGLASSRAEAQAAVEAGMVTVARQPRHEGRPRSWRPTRRCKSRWAIPPVRFPGRRTSSGRTSIAFRSTRATAMPRRGGVDRRVHRLPAAGRRRARGRGRRGLRAAGVGVAERSAGDGDGTDERPRAGRPRICRSFPIWSWPTSRSSRLRTVVPALVRSRGREAELLLLVKPQFEAGPADVGSGGVVRDPAVWSASSRDRGGVRTAGVGVVGVVASPLAVRPATWSSSCTAAGGRPRVRRPGRGDRGRERAPR